MEISGEAPAMAPSMGPPPSRNPNPSSETPPVPSPEASEDAQIRASEEAPTTTMSPETSDSERKDGGSNYSASTISLAVPPISSCRSSAITIPYSTPLWSAPPSHPFSLEVLKDGSIIEQLDVSRKGAYMFGRVDLCDFVLEHPTISRFHAVLQFKKDGEAFLYDLGSTHGTSVNKNQVKKKVYTEIHVGDVIRFGQSSRLYIFQGPSELMPPEGDLSITRKARRQEEMLDREASLLRAKVEASLTDGISWGMPDDAVEELTESGAEEEVTWQTFKGQLTERQEKTRSKLMKRMEKVSNMKKEINAIRAKDINQGGLTQGQQMQIARNEQRIVQIMEELESLEETLNESIQESIGARAKSVLHRKKGNDDEGHVLSDDDEFYDRTKKSAAPKDNSQSTVETAASLLAKKDAIIAGLEEKKSLLANEREKLENNICINGNEMGDDLDEFMSGISAQLVLDKTAKIQDEISNLEIELERVTYLLKIADPMGEGQGKREAELREPNCSMAISNFTEQARSEEKISRITSKQSIVDSAHAEISNASRSQKADDGCNVACQTENRTNSAHAETSNVSGQEKIDGGCNVACQTENRTPLYALTKPQWLGATEERHTQADRLPEDHADADDSCAFVDYKDRKKILTSSGVQEIESAAPGLIIRKRKPVENSEMPTDKAQKVQGPSAEAEAEAMANDAVALLLKHKRGYSGLDDDGWDKKDEKQIRDQSWVRPEGQSGDHRTALHDRLGY